MSEISELMARDPLDLTKDEVGDIVKYYRLNREKFVAGIKIPKTAAAAAPKAKLDLGSIDLGDITI